MSKPVINNRVIYNNLLGRVAQHDIFVNQGVTTGDSPTFNDIFILGDASITGNLYVEGNTTILNTNVLEFEDNVILINRQETGAGVTLNQAGLEVERGTLENYRMVFNESDDTFRVGLISNTQAVATREDNPLLDGVMIWNSTSKRLDSRNTIGIDLTLTSTTNSTSSSTGALKVSGGLGVNADINTSGKFYIRGTNNSNRSVLWTDTSNTFNLTSPAGINITPTTSIRIPYDKPLTMGTDNHKVLVNSTTNNMEIWTENDINFNLGFSKKITVPNGIPITFSTQNEKVYADNSNNMVIAGSQDINLVPGPSKRVFLDFDTPICFGNSNGKIYGTLIEDIYLKAGNNIVLSPVALGNVVIPTDNGIRFGNSGLQRIYANSSNELFVNSTGDIKFAVTSENITITGRTHLNFGNTNQYIWGETTSGTLYISATTIRTSNSSQVNIENTTDSGNSNTGALVVNGGAGIIKNLNVGGNVVIGGDLTVSGVTTTLNTETVLLEDNLLVLNSGPSPLSDGGMLVKRFQTGTSGSTDYAGLFYKQSDNTFVFADTLSDPGKSNVTINGYLSVRMDKLFLVSTTNATGLGTGGNLTIGGGASIGKDLYIGGDIKMQFSNAVVLTNTNGNVCSIRMQPTSGGYLDISSDNSIRFTSVNSGELSFWNSGTEMLNVNTAGNTKLTSTANSSGLGTGGALTISGGMSLAKDVFIGGQTTIYSTVNSTSVTNGAVMMFGGLSIACDTNATYGNGGSLSIAGGVYIEKDLYISGNIYSNNSTNELYSLNLTSTQPATGTSGSLVSRGGITVLNSTNSTSLTDGGSFLTYGGASINRDLLVGGDTQITGKATLGDNLNLTGGASFRTVVNSNTGANLWTYLGQIGTQYNLIANERGIKTCVNLAINGTTPTFSYDLTGDLRVNESAQFYVYKNGVGDSYHLFVLSKPATTVNLQVTVKDASAVFTAAEGFGVAPNGTTSNFNGGTWVLYWTTNGKETTTDYSIGDLRVEGNLKIYDNVPVIGSQDTNTNKVSGRDLGITFQRYQESSDVGSGDVVNDTPTMSITLPSQSTANNRQVIIGPSVNANDNYYLDWWIKSGNQVRKVTGYNGALRVAEIDTPWTIQPVENDVVILFNTQLPSVYWDESDKTFSLSYIGRDSDILLNNGDTSLRVGSFRLTHTTPSTSSTSGVLVSLGGIAISNTTDCLNSSNGGALTIAGGAAVRKKLFVGDRISISANEIVPLPSDSLVINQTTSSISLWNTVGSYSSLLFGGDKIAKQYALVNTNSDNLFSITYASTTGSPAISSKSLVINGDGNVGLKTTQNMNSLLTLKGGNFVTCDTDLQFLGIRGSTETVGSRIILNGNTSERTGDLELYAGATTGSMRIYTGSTQRITVNNLGIVNVLNTNISTNSSTGAFVLSGGIAIRSSVNATSASNGGSFTTEGGVGVKRDLYIGGDFYVDGKIRTIGGVTSPNIVITNTTNCSVISIENSSLVQINDEIIYSVSVIASPVVSSELTEFSFTLPRRTTNFTKLNGVNIQCSGFTGDETTLFNMTGVAVVGTTNCKIKFQSASTGVHYIQVLCRYTEG